MSKYQGLTVDDLSRLLELILKFAEKDECTATEAVDRLSNLVLSNTRRRPGQATIAVWADRVRQMRMRRNEIFGAPLFRDPAWDMLLELYAAERSGREIPLKSLCYASGVSLSTAARQIDILEKHELIWRVRDEQDRRRAVVRPTAKALAAIESAGAMIIQQMQWVQSAVSEAAHARADHGGSGGTAD
jgi:DNA-binding MarR family transcriptional regulator